MEYDAVYIGERNMAKFQRNNTQSYTNTCKHKYIDKCLILPIKTV